MDGGINGRLDEDDEFDSDLMFDVGVRSHIKQGCEEVSVEIAFRGFPNSCMHTPIFAHVLKNS